MASANGSWGSPEDAAAGSCPGPSSSSVPMSNSSGLFVVPISSVVSASFSSRRLLRAPPRDAIDSGRSLLSPRGEGCGLTRGGRGVRDRAESALGLGDLLGESEGLTPAGSLPSDSLSPRLLRLLELDGDGGYEIGKGAIDASSALGCIVGGRGVVVSSGVATPGLFPGGGGGLGGGLCASCPG